MHTQYLEKETPKSLLDDKISSDFVPLLCPRTFKIWGNEPVEFYKQKNNF